MDDLHCCLRLGVAFIGIVFIGPRSHFRFTTCNGRELSPRHSTRSLCTFDKDGMYHAMSKTGESRRSGFEKKDGLLESMRSIHERALVQRRS